MARVTVADRIERLRQLNRDAELGGGRNRLRGDIIDGGSARLEGAAGIHGQRASFADRAR